MCLERLALASSDFPSANDSLQILCPRAISRHSRILGKNDGRPSEGSRSQRVERFRMKHPAPICCDTRKAQRSEAFARKERGIPRLQQPESQSLGPRPDQRQPVVRTATGRLQVRGLSLSIPAGNSPEISVSCAGIEVLGAPLRLARNPPAHLASFCAEVFQEGAPALHPECLGAKKTGIVNRLADATQETSRPFQSQADGR